jgi:hypothetical protein
VICQVVYGLHNPAMKKPGIAARFLVTHDTG